jgi:hypothetical protein
MHGVSGKVHGILKEELALECNYISSTYKRDQQEFADLFLFGTMGVWKSYVSLVFC